MNSDKILFIQTAFVGDAILTLPAIQKLKEENPNHEIDVICIPESSEIFHCNSAVNNVIVLDKKKKAKSFLSTFRFAKDLKKNNYTKLYSAHRSFRTSLIVLLTDIRESFGFDNSSIKHVYKNLIEYDPVKHEVQRNLDLIGYKYDKNSWKIVPEIIAKESSVEKVNTFLTHNNIQDGFYAVAPGTVWETKKYPKEYFAEVIKNITKSGHKVILIGGKSDKELCKSFVTPGDDFIINTAGMFSLSETVELLKHAKILISNDSAPTHLGMAADIKVLTIFCSTVSHFGFYPFNTKSRFLSFDELNCKPCGIHGHKKCPIKTFDCGFNLKPEFVFKTLQEME